MLDVEERYFDRQLVNDVILMRAGDVGVTIYIAISRQRSETGGLLSTN